MRSEAAVTLANVDKYTVMNRSAKVLVQGGFLAYQGDSTEVETRLVEAWDRRNWLSDSIYTKLTTEGGEAPFYPLLGRAIYYVMIVMLCVLCVLPQIAQSIRAEYVTWPLSLPGLVLSWPQWPCLGLGRDTSATRQRIRKAPVVLNQVPLDVQELNEGARKPSDRDGLAWSGCGSYCTKGNDSTPECRYVQTGSKDFMVFLTNRIED